MSPILPKQFLNFNNNLYVVRRLIREEQAPVIDTWKEHLEADTVLRKDGILYFLQLVPDLEIITD
jgi:hypothetical protein